MANVCFPADAAAPDFTGDNCFCYTKVSGNKSGGFVEGGVGRSAGNSISGKLIDEAEVMPMA